MTIEVVASSSASSMVDWHSKYGKITDGRINVTIPIETMLQFSPGKNFIYLQNIIVIHRNIYTDIYVHVYILIFLQKLETIESMGGAMCKFFLLPDPAYFSKQLAPELRDCITWFHKILNISRLCISKNEKQFIGMYLLHLI